MKWTLGYFFELVNGQNWTVQKIRISLSYISKKYYSDVLLQWGSEYRISLVQWGLEKRTRKSECHTNSEHFIVLIWNGSVSNGQFIGQSNGIL